MVSEIIHQSDLQYNSESFNKAIAAELAGMLDKNVFQVVLRQDIREDETLLLQDSLLPLKMEVHSRQDLRPD